MALFLDDEFLAKGPRAETFRMLGALEGLFEASNGLFFPYRQASDARLAHDEGRLAGLFAIEGGEALEGSLDTLREYASHGLKLLGLTWNRRNELGRGVRTPGTDGLSVFGKSVVRECERLGVLVDASHLSDTAFDDLASCAERPFVASHSNCRALCGNLRNLDDGRIEAIAASGGLVGITFVADFVADPPGASSLDAILAQVDHAVKVAGVEHVGFGSDFDGYSPSHGDFMAGADSWPGLIQGLADHGYSEAEVAALAGGNWLRVLSGASA
jgi:membrane dipeptidase